MARLCSAGVIYLCYLPRMKRYLVFVLLFAGSALAQSADLGVTLGNLGGSAQKRVAIAKQLGAAWYRPEPVLLGEAEPKCDDCGPATAAGLKLALVVRNATEAKKPSGPVSDITAFQQKLQYVIGRFHPAIVVVENEPENQKDSFSGTPEEYGAELQAACHTAHALNVRCTDGALSSADIGGVVIDQLWKTDQEQAGDFGLATELVRARYEGGYDVSVLGSEGKKIGKGKSQEQVILKATSTYLEKHRPEIDRSTAFLAAAAKSNTDYANFHWYELKPEELTTVLDILGRLNKRPPMTDEVGQTEERPFETGEKIKILRQAGVKPIIWSGADGKGTVGLVDGKGNLQPTARAFQAAAQK